MLGSRSRGLSADSHLPPLPLTAGVSVSLLFAQRTLGRKRAHKGSFKDGECGQGRGPQEAAVGQAGTGEAGALRWEHAERGFSRDGRSRWLICAVLLGLESSLVLPFEVFQVQGTDRTSALTPGNVCQPCMGQACSERWDQDKPEGAGPGCGRPRCVHCLYMSRCARSPVSGLRRAQSSVCSLPRGGMPTETPQQVGEGSVLSGCSTQGL